MEKFEEVLIKWIEEMGFEVKSSSFDYSWFFDIALIIDYQAASGRPVETTDVVRDPVVGCAGIYVECGGTDVVVWYCDSRTSNLPVLFTDALPLKIVHVDIADPNLYDRIKDVLLEGQHKIEELCQQKTHSN